MLRLTLAFVDIMLHRRGPDSLPSSQFLFWLLLAAMLASSFAALVVDGVTPLGIAVVLSAAGFELWFVWAVLRLYERERRFRQTMSAVLGTDAIIGVLTLPLIAFADPPPAGSQEISFAGFAFLALVVWSIDITAFVLSRALDRPYLLTLVIVLAYFLLMYIFQASLLQLRTA
ncbi:MAG TPA: hypothetical protein VKA43_01150 [Gammaproteobacteria bacterium]|nr:hypothetical protein [Gammaproteobacteria bacterium]